MKYRIWIPLLLAVLGVFVCVTLADEQADTKGLEGKAAPEVKLSTLAGKDVTLSSMKGHVVVLDFWGDLVSPVPASMPHLNKVANDKELADKGLVVWAVNARETKDQVKDFLTKNKYDLNVPLDSNGTVMADYKVSGIPTQVVVGRDGTVQAVFVGFGGEESAKALDTAIDKALAEKAPAK